ncbi:hypothetical protein GYH30_054033 [Glycine max]|uniref:Uncharacterized protein n=1 Tax=Glycine max TaxID=3847 RepID=A0A0R0ES62_SOYBN|nr:hypothetical protein GYH30_054033 [Glycine max]
MTLFQNQNVFTLYRWFKRILSVHVQVIQFVWKFFVTNSPTYLIILVSIYQYGSVGLNDLSKNDFLIKHLIRNVKHMSDKC